MIDDLEKRAEEAAARLRESQFSAVAIRFDAADLIRDLLADRRETALQHLSDMGQADERIQSLVDDVERLRDEVAMLNSRYQPIMTDLMTAPEVITGVEQTEVPSDEGPQFIVSAPKFTCNGCRYLTTKYWMFEGENDDTDSGDSAYCQKADGKCIDHYWSSNSKSPHWCPISSAIITKDTMK